VDEGIVGGDPVLSVARVASVDIDAEDLAEHHVQLLGVAVSLVAHHAGGGLML
jgi:hypothetical protein